MIPPDRLLRALVEICGPNAARPAGPRDAVAGRPARAVAAPPTAAGVAATLRLARDEGLVVFTRGGGTKIDWGVPPDRVDLLLDTGRLNGLWHHTPGGTTAEVGAGTPVRAVQAALALRGQRLAIDSPSPGATLGGVLAVNESGPLRHRFGAPDSHVHDYHHVRSDGSERRTPGHATRDDDGPPPGVLISAVLDLQPVPEARCWVTVPAPTPLQVHNSLAATLDADVTPSGIEVDLPAAAPGEQPSGALAVLIEGDAAGVGRRADRLVAALDRLAPGEAAVAGRAPAWWGRYPFGPGEVALRLTVSAADLHSVVYALRDAARGAVPVRGSAGIGAVHAVLPRGLAPERVEQILEAVRGVLLGRGGHCVVVAAPPSVSARVDMAGRHELF